MTRSARRGNEYYTPYMQAVEAAGGEAVGIDASPALAEHDATAVIRDLDGVLFPGGRDVDPANYGVQKAPETEDVDPDLDATEIALVRAAIAAGTPVLGICRGQQLINVALGGSLQQHVDGHDMHGHPRSLLAHIIDIEPRSEFAAATETNRLEVNSLHHQVVRDVAPGLHVTALSEDGLIEGIESRDGSVVAVQCHPEELIAEHAWATRLMQRFVERARTAGEQTASKEQVR